MSLYDRTLSYSPPSARRVIRKKEKKGRKADVWLRRSGGCRGEAPSPNWGRGRKEEKKGEREELLRRCVGGPFLPSDLPPTGEKEKNGSLHDIGVSASPEDVTSSISRVQRQDSEEEKRKTSDHHIFQHTFPCAKEKGKRGGGKKLSPPDFLPPLDVLHSWGGKKERRKPVLEVVLLGPLIYHRRS